MEFDPPDRGTELVLLLEPRVGELVGGVGACVVAIEAVVVALAEKAVVCPEMRCGVNVRRR